MPCFFSFFVVWFLLCSLIGHVGCISGRLGVVGVISHTVHVSTQNAKHLFTSKYGSIVLVKTGTFFKYLHLRSILVSPVNNDVLFISAFLTLKDILHDKTE